MKLKTKLSRKDENLIIALVAGLLLYGCFMLVVRPIYRQSVELKKEIETAQNLQRDLQMKLSMLPVLELGMEKNKEILEQNQSQFYRRMGSTEVDRTVTGEIIKNKLFANNLSITLPKTQEDYTTLDSYRSVVYKEENQENAADEEDTLFPGLYTAQVRVSVSGSREEIRRYLDENLNRVPMQRVVSYSLSENALADTEQSISLDMVMELYMCDVEKYLTDSIADETTEEN